MFTKKCPWSWKNDKKKGKKGERKKEKEKAPTQLPGFELALLRRPAVASMACQKDPSEMSRSRSQPSEKEKHFSRRFKGK